MSDLIAIRANWRRVVDIVPDVLGQILLEPGFRLHLHAAVVILTSLMGLIHLQGLIQQLLMVTELLIVEKSVGVPGKWRHVRGSRTHREGSGGLGL